RRRGGGRSRLARFALAGVLLVLLLFLRQFALAFFECVVGFRQWKLLGSAGTFARRRGRYRGGGIRGLTDTLEGAGGAEDFDGAAGLAERIHVLGEAFPGERAAAFRRFA